MSAPSSTSAARVSAPTIAPSSIGHDWGAIASYGVVNSDPAAFSRLVTLAAPPAGALAAIFSYRQLKRSFYIWVIQQVGLAGDGPSGARLLGVAVGGLVAWV